jgi:hypothetical protein
MKLSQFTIEEENQDMHHASDGASEGYKHPFSSVSNSIVMERFSEVDVIVIRTQPSLIAPDPNKHSQLRMTPEDALLNLVEAGKRSTQQSQASKDPHKMPTDPSIENQGPDSTDTQVDHSSPLQVDQLIQR